MIETPVTTDPPTATAHDPSPPGKIAMWLFLASEVMFFVGILGAYLVLRSAAPQLFERHASTLNTSLATINTVVLLLSSLTMALAVDSAVRANARRTASFLAITVACGVIFCGIKAVEYRGKLQHYTAVAFDPHAKTNSVFDGHLQERTEQELVLRGFRSTTTPGFNIHLVSPSDVRTAADREEAQLFRIPITTISQSISYGPWKNNFYASYFTLTGLHVLHLLGGMVAILILLIHALRGTTLGAATEYVGLYWHFVDVVWIFLFPLLYLI